MRRAHYAELFTQLVLWPSAEMVVVFPALILMSPSRHSAHSRQNSLSADPMLITEENRHCVTSASVIVGNHVCMSVPVIS